MTSKREQRRRERASQDKQEAGDRAALEARVRSQLTALEQEVAALRDKDLADIARAIEGVRKRWITLLPELRADTLGALTLGPQRMKQVEVARLVKVGAGRVSELVGAAMERLEARKAAARNTGRPSRGAAANTKEGR